MLPPALGPEPLLDSAACPDPVQCSRDPMPDQRAESVAAAASGARAPDASPRDPVPGAASGGLHPAARRVVDAAARAGVALEVHVFDASTHTAEDAARSVGAELGQIVKSLVFVAPAETGGLEPIVCLVSGTNRVDLARLAAVTGRPDVRRATAREATELTGFTIGGIPPIGHARPVRVVMDPDLGRYPEVWAAAGTDRAVFPVAPAALQTLSDAVVAPIAEERPTAASAGTPGSS